MDPAKNRHVDVGRPTGHVVKTEKALDVPPIEIARQCPRDGTIFTVTVESGEEIFRCPTCNWLERRAQSHGIVVPPTVVTIEEITNG